MIKSPYSTSQQLMVLMLAPPALAMVWWLMARNGIAAMRPDLDDGEIKTRQKQAFWGMLIVLYVIVFSCFAYRKLS